jgi:hypothetical protein
MKDPSGSVLERQVEHKATEFAAHECPVQYMRKACDAASLGTELAGIWNGPHSSVLYAAPSMNFSTIRQVLTVFQL